MKVTALWRSAGSFHDSTRTQMSIVAIGDLAHWDVRRFRPNLVLDADTAIGSWVTACGSAPWRSTWSDFGGRRRVSLA